MPSSGYGVEDIPLKDVLSFKRALRQAPGAKVPKGTPPAGRKYRELELLFQESAKAQGKSVRQLDTEVWQSYARN